MYPCFVACGTGRVFFIYFKKEVVVISECSRRNGEADAVIQHLLVITIK